MPRIPYTALTDHVQRALERVGFTPARAALCATLFAQTTCDGVYTHGMNRFPRFLQTIANGVVDPHAEPTLTTAFGAMERWNGNRGPGNLNAYAAMNRALALAGKHGLGAVFLANANHWMRGGTYGWQAANAGCLALCFTNTLPNLPPWGAAAPRLGNNPMVLAVPRTGGDHVVLDMAMSQYSYGTLSAYAQRGQALPFPGGFAPDGELTTDAAAIAQTERALPIGLWKGSGLSLMLDLFAAMLSGGKSTHQIARDPLQETGLSQFFLAIDPSQLASAAELTAIADAVIAGLHASEPLNPDRPVRYPGEETLRLRQENMTLGVPVEDAVWQQVLAAADKIEA